MTCGRVGFWKDRPTFEELAVMFEGSTASGAERAYRRAVDKLTELLVAEGAIHAVRLKQKSKTKRKKKIAAAIYEYQADCDSEWGEIVFDFESGTVMNGHSKIRNKGIANIFSQMGLVEAWGSGIKRILNAAEAYGLSKPRFQEFDNMFRVELFRNSFPMTNEKEDIGETSEKHRRSIGETSEAEWRTDLNDTQQKIIKLLSEDRQLSAVKLAEKIGVASRNIENNIKKLKEYGILIRHGSPKNGYWEIVDKDLQE